MISLFLGLPIFPWSFVLPTSDVAKRIRGFGGKQACPWGLLILKYAHWPSA